MLWCGTSKKIMKSHSGNVKNGATSPKHKRFERRVWGSVFTESSPSQGRLKQLSLLAKTNFLGSGARCEPPTVYFAANDGARFDALNICRTARRVATAIDWNSQKVYRCEDLLTTVCIKPTRYTSAEQAAVL